MRRVFVYLMAWLIGVSLMGLAFAGQPGEPGTSKPVAVEKSEPGKSKSVPAPEKSEGAKEAMGEVVKADPGKMTLVIKTAGKQLSFSVSEQAGRALVTLKPGDKVMVQYTEAQGKRTVQEIRKG